MILVCADSSLIPTYNIQKQLESNVAVPELNYGLSL